MSAHLNGLIQTAYDIIGTATPVTADCGKLCGAACCQGGDDVGMLLYPGEAVRLSGVTDFRLFRIRYMDSRAWLLTCPGSCRRDMRPLSCRIFPLAPHVDKTGRVTALPDPRARLMCPLAGGEYLDIRFRRLVGKAFAVLAQDPKMLEFMERLSRELAELRRFYSN